MISLILGGARSGKSTFAEKLASASAQVTYIATADAKDDEMAERIAIHQERRPPGWRTWEGDIERLPEEIGRLEGTLLLDCLTMLITRLFLSDEAHEAHEKTWFAREREILDFIGDICEKYRKAHATAGSHLIIVSNEVGFGLVPTYLMGRRFRDMQGRANQLTAGYSDNTALVVAGIPLWIKGGKGLEK